MKYLILLLVIYLTFADQCSLSDPQKVDCGFMGINQQQCQGKGCCWKPTNLNQQLKQGGTPWCFFPAGQNPCETFNLKGTQGMGFDDSIYQKMNALFESNINIQGKGGVVAAPDHSTPGGSYYYHWMRDAALTIRTFMELNNFNYSIVKQKVNAYAQWVKKVQHQVDPQGFDVRINPKFQLPNGQVFVGGWCRPQTDGPGLRSGALFLYGEVLLNNGQQSYFKQQILPIIQFDMDWVFNNWSSDGCDLWQQVRSNDFFWNRMSYMYTFEVCKRVADKIGDSSLSSKCSSTRNSVQATLDGHWTGSFMKQSANREKDTSVIHAFSSFGVYPFTDSKVSKTISTLAFTFCGEYLINQNDNKNNIPGMLFGRYPGDSYAGGNPWQLLTAVSGKIFYQGAVQIMQSNGFQDSEDKQSWLELLSMKDSNPTNQQIVKASIQAGDAIMWRMYKYVKDDNGHIAEQIGRNSGKQTSANDLTWSYANVLSAMQARSKAKAMFQMQLFE